MIGPVLKHGPGSWGCVIALLLLTAVVLALIAMASYRVAGGGLIAP